MGRITREESSNTYQQYLFMQLQTGYEEESRTLARAYYCRKLDDKL